MSHADPGYQPAAVTAPIADKRPAVVTAAGCLMLAVALAGGLAAMTLLSRLVDVALYNSNLPALLWRYEFQFLLLIVALCAVVAVLAILAWQGYSVARLAVTAALGSAATMAAAMTVSHLAIVLYTLDRRYEDDWKLTLVVMWMYLAAAVVLLVPVLLVNRPKATKWFLARRGHRTDPLDPDYRPQELKLARTGLVVLSALTVIGKGWDIGSVVSGPVIAPGDDTDSLIRTLAYVIVPLLILTAAIIEVGAGSRLGQIAAFLAVGHALFEGLRRLPFLLSGSWLEDWRAFGEVFNTVAVAGVAVVTLVLLLRPRIVDYLAIRAVDIEPDYLLAAEADDD